MSNTNSNDTGAKPGSTSGSTNEPGSKSGTAPEKANETGGKAASSAKASGGDLETQVARLREDVANVAETLKSLAGNRADSARSQAFALRDDVRETGERYLRQAQDAASDFEEQISERVRSEPIKSVLIAAAVGYVYARLFR